MPLPDALRERRIVPGRSPATQSVALARDLVAHAMAQSAQTDLGESIHQVRLVLKALRALLRLFPNAASGKPPAALESRLRGLGQQLSPTRDRDVAFATLAALASKHGNPRQNAAARRWLGGLRRDVPDRETVSGTTARLARLQPAILRHLRRSASADLLASALARSLRKSRRWNRRARETEEPEAFHAWRRWQKRLETQLRWTLPRGVRGVRALLGELHAQQEQLGRLHDLDVLAACLAVTRDGTKPTEARDAKAVLPLVLERQRRLKSRLARGGGRIPTRRVQRAIRAVQRG